MKKGHASESPVYSSRPEGVLIRFNEEWDMPRADVEQMLVDNNVPMDAFWQAYQSLFEPSH